MTTLPMYDTGSDEYALPMYDTGSDEYKYYSVISCDGCLSNEASLEVVAPLSSCAGRLRC
jgi:hypothetical protein